MAREFIILKQKADNCLSALRLLIFGPENISENILKGTVIFLAGLFAWFPFLLAIGANEFCVFGY